MTLFRFGAVIAWMAALVFSGVALADQSSDARELEQALGYQGGRGFVHVDQTLRVDGCRAELAKIGTSLKNGKPRYAATTRFEINLFSIDQKKMAIRTDPATRMIFLRGNAYDDPRSMADLVAIQPLLQAAVDAGDRIPDTAMMTALYSRVIDGEFGQRLVDNHFAIRFVKEGNEEFSFEPVEALSIEVDPDRRPEMLGVWLRYAAAYCPPS